MERGYQIRSGIGGEWVMQETEVDSAKAETAGHGNEEIRPAREPIMTAAKCVKQITAPMTSDTITVYSYLSQF